jgi:hypothetical protein
MSKEVGVLEGKETGKRGEKGSRKIVSVVWWYSSQRHAGGEA